MFHVLTSDLLQQDIRQTWSIPPQKPGCLLYGNQLLALKNTPKPTQSEMNAAEQYLFWHQLNRNIKRCVIFMYQSN